MAYKVGDKVRIVSKRPKDRVFADDMGKYLGKTFTVSMVKWYPYVGTLYSLEGAITEHGICAGSAWMFKESWISGLAEPEQKPYTVELRFDGAITTATLKRDGRDVKTAEAYCNPKDTYSRAEGARVAVERLFEKKRKEDKPEKYTPKVGDRFLVVSNPSHYCSSVGKIVTLYDNSGSVKLYKDSDGALLYIRDCNVKPYKEKSK